MKVLYVDDEPSMLDISREFLEMEGTSSSTPPSVKKALEDSCHNLRLQDARWGQDRVPEDAREKGQTAFHHLHRPRPGGVVVDAAEQGRLLHAEGQEPLVQFEELRNVILQLAQRSRAEKALGRGKRSSP